MRAVWFGNSCEKDIGVIVDYYPSNKCAETAEMADVCTKVWLPNHMKKLFYFILQ